MDWILFGKATFSDGIYTGAFADTRERGGSEKSELLGTRAMTFLAPEWRSGLGLGYPHRRHASGRCKEF